MGKRDRFMTIEAAASRLVCHPETVRRRIAAGRLTPYADGCDRRRYLVSEREVDRVARPVPVRGAHASEGVKEVPNCRTA
jgi:excisionase family DNA binding protein